MTSLKEAARLLGGHVAGGQVLCPGPDGHSAKDRSLAVRFGAEFPDGFTVFSHCGDNPIRCRDHVRALLGLPAFSPGCSSSAPTRPRPPKPPEAPPKPDERALRIWNDAGAIEGTLAEQYLREHRKIELAELPVVLRYISALRHPFLAIFSPAMVAALAQPGTPVLAIQATYLNMRSGAKASINEPRVTIGKMFNGAVQLGEWPTETLGLAEGAESALSAAQLFGTTTWAALGAQRLPSIAVPSSIKEIHIFSDNDEAGTRAAELAVERFTSEGKAVVVHQPPA